MIVIDRWINRYRSKIISTELKRIGKMPKLEFSLLGPFLNCTASFNQDEHCGIDVDATCGMSRSSEIALSKALVEFVERMAVREHVGAKGMGNKTSDGFAAYPRILSLNFKKNARENALNEAIERYSWMRWWQDSKIGFRIFEAPDSISSDLQRNSFVQSDCMIERIFVVEPHIEGAKGSLKILIAKLAGRGYVTGGAFHQSHQIVMDRALGELMRHYIGYVQLLRVNREVKNLDWYNGRLEYFASGEGNFLVENRLSIGSPAEIVLPPIYFDKEINHRLSDSVYVHRCLFENQQEFLDHRKDIFCL
ncbi:MAG: hypothetical protein CL676_06090 [Bdellovibrionaceae bacterium]|nr:hypothetical protein [Pseudobdellovibrionaceae bacterium]|tara:strand:+ start:700 stop:1620 length:921 start_codon:yes stop_codon:yes gene_type:complete